MAAVFLGSPEYGRNCGSARGSLSMHRALDHEGHPQRRFWLADVECIVIA